MPYPDPPIASRAPRPGRPLGRRIPVVDVLGQVAGLDDDRFERARRIRARTLGVRRGLWDAATDVGEHAPDGFLVVSGALLRHVTAGHREGAELLGPGDLIQPASEKLPEVSWRALADTVLAILDGPLMHEAAAVPELVPALLSAAASRANTVARQLVVAQWSSADERIVATLSMFADRWGVVTPRGVALPAFLTHAVLAPLVGARRPSVTTALQRLHATGRVRRAEDGRWLLAAA